MRCPGDGDDVHRWTAGEREPDWERLQPWLDHLSASRERGVVPVLDDARGGFVGSGVPARDLGDQWLVEAETAWDGAKPFGQWWERHPELRRH